MTTLAVAATSPAETLEDGAYRVARALDQLRERVLLLRDAPDVDEYARRALDRIVTEHLTPATTELRHTARCVSILDEAHLMRVARRLHELVYRPWVDTLLHEDALTPDAAGALETFSRLDFDSMHPFGQGRARDYALRLLGGSTTHVPREFGWSVAMDRRLIA